MSLMPSVRFYIVILSVIMLSVIVLSVIVLNVIVLSVIVLSVIRLRVIVLSVIVLSVIVPSVIVLNVIVLSVIMLSVIVLSVIMLSVIVLSVIMLTVLWWMALSRVAWRLNMWPYLSIFYLLKHPVQTACSRFPRKWRRKKVFVALGQKKEKTLHQQKVACFVSLTCCTIQFKLKFGSKRFPGRS